MHIGIDKIEDVKKSIDENYVESPFDDVLQAATVRFCQNFNDTSAIQYVTCSEESVKKYLGNVSSTWQQSVFSIIDKKYESNPTEWKDSKVYKRAMITKQTFSKIRNETNYHPDKETAVKMCFGLKLNIDETVDLLAKAGYTLSMSIKQDLIIRYFIEHKAYDVIDLNNMFYSFKLPYYKT